MSIKTKLSLISMFVLLVFIPLYYTISDYYSAQQFNERVHKYIFNTSKDYSEKIEASWDEADVGSAVNVSSEQFLKNINSITFMIPFIEQIMVIETNSGKVVQPQESEEKFIMLEDSFVQEAAFSDQEVHKIEKQQNNKYRSYFNNHSQYTIIIDYNMIDFYHFFTVKRDYRWWLMAAFMLVATIVNYNLMGVMMRPLKDILWKVNEVSSVRFHKPILIRSKDEFGLLALKINAMSQNISIYMNKLRKAFEENKRMKEHLESFINHSNDAIHIINMNGKTIQTNRAFEQLFGYQEADLIHLKYPTIPEAYQAENQQMLEMLKAGKKLPPMETLRITKSGETIPVSVTVSPIRDSDGTIRAFASICRDMRSRNKMEELLRRSEKLTTVGQLTAGVAHEIRNPLTTLRGFLQLQQQSKKLNMSHVSLMLSELDRINLIVGEFLILAKPQATKFVIKDVRDVLHDVLIFLDSEAHLHNVEFRTSFTTESCSISCEENQLKQVFINLFKNAIEAMPNGGAIHITIVKRSQHISISIRDEGIGIPEDIIEKIGDPFFTAKESGTGLGIMVSQRIINTHQGTLDIDSQVNFGTTVRLTLPALKEARVESIL
ncbi:ATP-binding protein [Paenibacillus sp. GXUN7292]|uniref:ATP-binding protein n=1 Tax=Paenibacillus sp. GXUN7292 TaxID=3422499 RepID=UPI003D7DCC72